MKIGYARVSTQDQHLDLQVNALQSAGCTFIYHDHGVSGVERNRPGLAAAFRRLKAGDTLVVWRLDRLGRSLSHLDKTVKTLRKKKISFHSLTEAIDTGTSTGQLIFHILASVSEFERSLISERTVAGIAAARAKGQSHGRRRSLNDEQSLEVVAAFVEKQQPLSQIAQRFNIHPRTVRRCLIRMGKLP